MDLTGMMKNSEEESDKAGSSFLLVDREIDKIIISIEIISKELEKLGNDSMAIKLKDILETGISPYVADFGELLNNMEIE